MVNESELAVMVEEELEREMFVTDLAIWLRLLPNTHKHPFYPGVWRSGPTNECFRYTLLLVPQCL